MDLQQATNKIVCVWCQSSLHMRRTHALPEGPERHLISERISPRDIPTGGRVCYACWVSARRHVQRAANIDERGEDQDSHNHRNVVCASCEMSLFQRQQTHSLVSGPVRDAVSARIYPREVPDGSQVCYACWVLARSNLQQQDEVICDESASSAFTNTCVWCRCSLNRRRSHSIPEGPERNEIFTRIYPRQIPTGGRVCYACWVSARRYVQRAANIDERGEDQDSHNHRNVVCASCEMSLFRRQTHSLVSGPVRDAVAARIYPREISEHALICKACWTQTVEDVQILRENEEVPRPRMATMELDQFTHTTSSSRNCFVPLCTRSERLRVPDYLRKRILTSQKVFVTENARICAEHKSLDNWEFLDKHEFSSTFTKNEMESMLNLSKSITEEIQGQEINHCAGRA